jgi:hypothetical protein
MAPERNRHALAKAAAFRAFDRAIAAAGLPCTVFPDGASVAIDDATLYEPGLSVTCAGLDLTPVAHPTATGIAG